MTSNRNHDERDAEDVQRSNVCLRASNKIKPLEILNKRFYHGLR